MMDWFKNIFAPDDPYNYDPNDPYQQDRTIDMRSYAERNPTNYQYGAGSGGFGASSNLETMEGLAPVVNQQNLAPYMQPGDVYPQDEEDPYQTQMNLMGSFGPYMNPYMMRGY